MFKIKERQLYIDPVLQAKINIKKLEKEDIRDFKSIVSFVWEVYLKTNFEIKGYNSDKGRVILTTNMQRTSVKISKNLNNKITEKLKDFGKVKYGKISFSQITNELLKRIYLDEEF